MAYAPTKWEDSPSEKTPLNASNLNNLEKGVSDLHTALESGELKGDKGDKGDPGKDGVAVITPESLGYGLSENAGKIELGRVDANNIRIIDTPTEEGGFLIGRMEGLNVHGIAKSKGYMALKEGTATVGLISGEEQAIKFDGQATLVGGKCKAQVYSYHTSIAGQEDVFIGVGDGIIKPAITVQRDGAPRAHIDNYESNAVQSEYFIVNKKYLQSELAKLIARIEALEAK